MAALYSGRPRGKLAALRAATFSVGRGEQVFCPFRRRASSRGGGRLASPATRCAGDSEKFEVVLGAWVVDARHRDRALM